MTKNSIHQVVTMIAGESDLKMITVDAGVIHMTDTSTYDIARLVKEVTPQLTGSNIVEVDLDKYMLITNALTDSEYEENGIIINHMVDGKMVQGIFYPEKVSVQVQTSPEEEPVTIPNVESLSKQIARASEEDSPAVRNFLKRLAPVARDRKHSAEDLMNFIKRCEMPLTHDGRIIGYKRVNQTGNPGEFKDCHSGKVLQRVGSRVMMDIDGVDPDRNRSCSHGLHVANLGYLNGFHGSHILMVLIDPANFIAVPHGENTKCRVCSYDIFGIVTGSAKDVVSHSGVPEDATFDSLILDAIEGRAIVPDEVVVAGQRCMLDRRPITEEELIDPILPKLEKAKESVKSSPKSLSKDPEPETKVKGNAKEALNKARGTMSKKWTKAPENVIKAFDLLHAGQTTKAEIARQVETSTRSLQRWQDKYDYDGYVKSKTSNMTVAQRARQMFNEKAYQALVTFKKAKKKSFSSLGFSPEEEETILQAV